MPATNLLADSLPIMTPQEFADEFASAESAAKSTIARHHSWTPGGFEKAGDGAAGVSKAAMREESLAVFQSCIDLVLANKFSTVGNLCERTFIGYPSRSTVVNFTGLGGC